MSVALAVFIFTMNLITVMQTQNVNNRNYPVTTYRLEAGHNLIAVSHFYIV
mgnify:CR=1